MQNKIIIFILALFGVLGFIMLATVLYAFLFDSFLKETGAVIIMSILGASFFAVGFIPLLLLVRKRIIKNRLQQTGRCIQAKVISVEYNTLLNVNGRSPFVIYCQWSDPLMKDKVYLYKSGNIWFDPSDFIKGNTITVYIDQHNPKRYYVDLSFLPIVC